MKNRILAMITRSIPYVKELRILAKSTNGCILMQQLDYWFAHYPDGFYKFISPCDNVKYKKGDSWQEELGFSRKEFDGAFLKIGKKHSSLNSFRKSETKFEGMYYCSVFDRQSGLTTYYRNHSLLDNDLLVKLSQGNTVFAKREIPIRQKGNTDSPKGKSIYTDSTTDSTSKELKGVNVLLGKKKGDSGEVKMTKPLLKESPKIDVLADSKHSSGLDEYTYRKGWRKALGKLNKEINGLIEDIEVSRPEFIESFIDFAYGTTEPNISVPDMKYNSWKYKAIKLLEAHARHLGAHGIINNKVKTKEDLKADHSEYKEIAKAMFDWATEIYERKDGVGYSNYRIKGKISNDNDHEGAISLISEALLKKWINTDQFKAYVVSSATVSLNEYSGNFKLLFADYAKEFKRYYPAVLEGYLKRRMKDIREYDYIKAYDKAINIDNL